ncbi:MAG: cytochrome c oxidase subunit II [Gemmatimonadaceae bacterium]
MVARARGTERHIERYWLLLTMASACSGSTSTLDARGPAAETIADLWWVMLGLAGLVFLAVLAFLLPTLRKRTPASHRPHTWLAGAIGTSAVILTTLFIVSERTMGRLHHVTGSDDLRVSVKGWQWWWEVAYIVGSDTVVTANEIHIPTGRRVRLELTTGDVIHSLWVPNLQGKTDLVPGRTHLTWLQADHPGISYGPCAEYCGVQHAHMTLVVVALAPAEFAAWLQRERLPATPPIEPQRIAGAGVFARAGCAYCHMVRGTTSLGKLGPDLTHFASRRTIAAATLENAPRHLTAWLADPQRVKPGTRMPTTPLAARDLAAVVAYVSGLR